MTAPGSSTGSSPGRDAPAGRWPRCLPEHPPALPSTLRAALPLPPANRFAHIPPRYVCSTLALINPPRRARCGQQAQPGQRHPPLHRPSAARRSWAVSCCHPSPCPSFPRPSSRDRPAALLGGEAASDASGGGVAEASGGTWLSACRAWRVPGCLGPLPRTAEELPTPRQEGMLPLRLRGSGD